MLRAPAPGLVRLRRRHCRTHAEKGKLLFGEAQVSAPSATVDCGEAQLEPSHHPCFFSCGGFSPTGAKQELAKRQVPPCTVRCSDARGAWGALPAGDLRAARLRGVELFAYFSVLFLGFGVAPSARVKGAGHQHVAINVVLSHSCSPWPQKSSPRYFLQQRVSS